MYKQILTLALLIDIFFISCDKKENSSFRTRKIEQKIVFNKKDSINLVLDHKTQLSILHWNFTTEKDSIYLLNYNMSPLNISKINLLSGKIKREYFFETQGPNGINGSVTGFYYYNKDSIFILSGFNNKILLFNDESQIINTYDIDNNFTVKSDIDHRVFLHNNKLFVSGYDYLDSSLKSYVDDAKIILKLDLQNKNQARIINYPDEYKNHIWKREYLLTYFTVVNKFIYVSFGKSHFIYKYDLDGNYIERFEAKSKFVKNARSLGNKDNNSPKMFNRLYKNGYYTKIIYDKYRGLFYRFSYHLPQNLQPVNGEYEFDDLALSVMVLDRNLNMLKEFAIDENVNGWYSFLSNEGLGLSLKPFRMDNCTGDEECLKFYMFSTDSIK